MGLYQQSTQWLRDFYTNISSKFGKNNDNKGRLYYVLAFGNRYEALIKSSEYKRLSQSQQLSIVYKLSYYRMLSAFNKYINNSDADMDNIEDRRMLQYAYMSPNYLISDPEGTLNRFKFNLPVNNIVERAMNLICSLYDEQPRRLFYQSEDKDTELKEIYDNIGMDTKMKSIHKFGKLAGLVAVKPFYYNDKMYIDVKGPDIFHVERDRITNEINKITIFDFDSLKNEYLYHVWTDNIYYSYSSANPNIYLYYNPAIDNYEREKIPRANPYNKIPYVFLEFGSGMFEMCEQNLNINTRDFQADNSAEYEAINYKIAKNIDPAAISFSPDKMIFAEDIAKDEMVEPDIHVVEGSGAFMALNEYARNKELKMLQNEDIPNSMIVEQNQAQSGIAKMIDEKPLNNKRRNEISIMKEFERKFADMLINILNIDGGNNYADLDNFNIDYEDPAYYMERESEYEFDKSKVKNYDMDILDFKSKWAGLDAKADINEMEMLIKQRVENQNRINAITGPTGEEPETSENIEPDTEIIEKV